MPKPVPLTAFRVDTAQRHVILEGRNPLDIDSAVIVVPFGVMMLAAAQVIGHEGSTEMARMGQTSTMLRGGTPQ